MTSTILRRILLVAVVILILAAVIPGKRYYRYFSNQVSTDDAYVDGRVGLISPRVQGTVVKVFVENNWQVKTGDRLVQLDPTDYDVRVRESEAQLERARQNVDQSYAQVAAAQAGLKLAESQLIQARIDYDRAKSLKAQGVVSTEFFDQATTGLRVALATQALARHQMLQAEAALGPASEDHERYDRPIVQQAEAELEAAKLDLSYTTIEAPFDGIVTRKAVHIGHRVEVGEPLLALVPVLGLYITANYKETQLTDVRVGQPTEITADIYPDYVYRGHVDSISMGTGAAFALLPPENATGNWVKVVQRVPVKIVLDHPEPSDKPLRMGLSVETSIDISNKRGPLLSSTLQRQFFERGLIPETLRAPRAADNGSMLNLESSRPLQQLQQAPAQPNPSAPAAPLNAR